MGLDEYRARRDFDRTGEPRGGRRRGSRKLRSFVIQKHAARRLHHDFRLELDGVLVSWAVPKGPPVARGARVLAVRTEDHPLDYADFEGVIPQGQYGGGTVMLWDRGSWSADGDPRAGLRDGRLDFELDGERLRGRWTLVRTGGDRAEHWLWIKRSDTRDDARTAAPGLDRSVASGRSMDAIARDADPVGASADSRQPDATPTGLDLAALPSARRADQPDVMSPQLASLAASPPAGDDWLHEIKYDGYRLIAHLTPDAVRLRTRNGHDWTARFPTIARALAALGVERAIVDGEAAVLDRHGATDFQALQQALSSGDAARHVFLAFDLPHLDGHDLTAVPLVERKRALEVLLAGADDAAPNSPLRFSPHVVGDGAAFFAHCCALRLEGVVSKRADARYTAGRGRSWVKTKCLRRQEFVVAGWIPSDKRGRPFAALLLGVHAADGLRYAGRVGTGFAAATMADLAARLVDLETEAAPFAVLPARSEVRGARWTEPRLVVEVAFGEWTTDGRLRHPRFEGLREDKAATAVVAEVPARGEADAEAARRGVASMATNESVDTGDAADEFAGVLLSNPDRVLYPEQGLTKRDLARYHTALADRLLDHVGGRPLTVVRCPRGRDANCFYQKHVHEGLPAPIRAYPLARSDGSTERFLGVEDAAGLVALVQLGVLELHPWGSRADRPERPDRIVLDLDPGPGVEWPRVVAAAHGLRTILAALELESFVRTTGGKGLHVVVPIERRASWDEVKGFARGVVAALADRDPDRFVLASTKGARPGRIYLDWLRNGRGATAIATWSPRARAGAPVAMPLAWAALDERTDPAEYTVRSVPGILARQRRDPWAGFDTVRQRLTAAMRRAVGAG